MIKKSVILCSAAALFIVVVGCGTVDYEPGDTEAQTRTLVEKKEPGNILAEGRIDGPGR